MVADQDHKALADSREKKPYLQLALVRAPMIPGADGRTHMLTRRGFTGFASCAICGLAGFIATDASAQNAQPSAGITRKILSQIDGPIPGYTTISADVTLDPGAKIPRHTHPGIESSVVMEEEFELPIEGQR